MTSKQNYSFFVRWLGSDIWKSLLPMALGEKVYTWTK